MRNEPPGSPCRQGELNGTSQPIGMRRSSVSYYINSRMIDKPRRPSVSCEYIRGSPRPRNQLVNWVSRKEMGSRTKKKVGF